MLSMGWSAMTSGIMKNIMGPQIVAMVYAVSRIDADFNLLVRYWDLLKMS